MRWRRSRCCRPHRHLRHQSLTHISRSRRRVDGLSSRSRRGTNCNNRTNASGSGQGIVGAGGPATDGIVDWRVSFAEFVSEEEDCGRVVDAKMNSQGKRYTAIDQNRFDDHKLTATPSKRWSKERSIRENLELWFGSPLPSPLSSSATDKSDFLVECGICYTHRLPTEDSNTDEGPLPEVKCGNLSCSRHYHESCLFEWLHSLPTARVSFDRIFGSCPYCLQGISVKTLNGTNNQG